MKTLWIVPIETIDQRYTKQWYDNIPKIIGDRVKTSEKAKLTAIAEDGNKKLGGAQATMVDTRTSLYIFWGT